ncbi:MAG: hypothetical protein C4289_10050, partial [Chloroflexota bacterium]
MFVRYPDHRRWADRRAAPVPLGQAVQAWPGDGLPAPENGKQASCVQAGAERAATGTPCMHSTACITSATENITGDGTLITQMSPSGALPVELLPASARINAAGHLEIGGIDAVELARRFGTPLYIFDETEIRRRCRAVRAAFQREYPDALPIYASKAYLDPFVAHIVAEEGLGLDVVSGGEIGVAQRAGFPLERAYFHGNNKQREELELALDAGVGHIVIDNFYEIELLEQVAAAKGRRARALLRVSPGVEAHTHDYLKTGILDTKFGFPLATGQAAEAVARTLAQPHIELVGLHAHIGTQIFEKLPYAETVDLLLQFAGEMQRQHGFQLRQISPGGGWGINYTRTDTALPVEEWAQTVAAAVQRGA